MSILFFHSRTLSWTLYSVKFRSRCVPGTLVAGDLLQQDPGMCPPLIVPDAMSHILKEKLALAIMIVDQVVIWDITNTGYWNFKTRTSP